MTTKQKIINPEDVADVYLGATATDPNIKNTIKADTVPMGLFCTKLDESVPRFEAAPCEKVIKNKSNSFIVLGRDRNVSLASGYGGKGATGAGMIDLVVGRLAGAKSVFGNKSKDKKTLTGPNFASDAARVYISQKADIDEYFGLPPAEGFQVIPAKARSAVGIKADHTRIIGRNDVKIFAGQMRGMEGFGPISGGEPNSQAGPIDNTQCHIYLQGGGSENVQPVIKGENLKRYLIKVADREREQMNNMLSVLTQLAVIVGAMTAVLGPTATKIAKDNIEKATNQVLSSLNSKLDEMTFFGLDVGSETFSVEEDSILSKNVFTT